MEGEGGVWFSLYGLHSLLTCCSPAQEEGEDSTFVSSRRVHNPLEHSEPPGKQGLPESERVWTEERLHPARPYAEED